MTLSKLSSLTLLYSLIKGITVPTLHGSCELHGKNEYKAFNTCVTQHPKNKSYLLLIVTSGLIKTRNSFG